MDPLTVVTVLPLNKKEDHAVVIWTRNIKNNVILHAIVDLPLLVKRRTNSITRTNLINPRNKPVKPQVIAIPLVIAFSTPIETLIVDPVSHGYKKVGHVVVIWTLSSKDNVILHVNADILEVVNSLASVKNKNQTQDIFCILSNGNY
jgi:hypothetical protein